MAEPWRCEECGGEKKGRYRGVCYKCYRRRRASPRLRTLSRLSSRRSSQKLKYRVLEELGGHCACCGEWRLEFLTVDHISGNGAEHRKQLIRSGSQKSANAATVYRHIMKQGCPRDQYRVLCFNCNCSIGTWGYCAHERPHDRKYPYVLGMEPVLE
jgi:hypothetical protein